jgi:hypothetical protein
MHIGREALMTIGEKFTLGLWVRLTSDTEESLLEEMKADADTYKFVTSENIQDGYDFRIEVDVASLSSVSKDAEKTKLFEFLSAIQNFQFIVLSPKLIRETAYRIGYNNEAVIREMQHMALLQQLGTVAGINQAMPQGNAGQQIAANRTPPKQEQIRNQLTQQLRPN